MNRARPEISGRDVVVFASHSHGDHYSPVIFGWRGGAPPRAVRPVGRHPDAGGGVPDRPRGDARPRGPLGARARSTDAGAAFLVRTDGKTIFHAATSTGGTGTARRIPATRGWRATTGVRSTPCAGRRSTSPSCRRPAPGGQVPLGDRLFHARGGRRYGGADAPVGTVRPHRPPARGGDGRALPRPDRGLLPARGARVSL